ncbi:glutaredoxin [Thiogranum longum]|uniref:Glutaredoxin n=1 Tax=Thiogranum longum TaxID=1537524 RepID=A0A4R1HBF1_9GAMM|nr:glutaredoxin [Thiogranum longum]TCK17931.1 glutaredoxin [Thiogranum longum]
MRILIRMFFKLVRAIVGPFLLLWEKITAPKGKLRTEAEQQRVDEATRHLAIYQFRTCPFCIKTRQAMRRLSLNIELRDAQKNPLYRQELLEGGGEVKVPCLRISREDGQVLWLYESDRIIEWLDQHFG